MATRSEIWRTFWIRVPAATTGAERSASNVRAIDAARGAPAAAPDERLRQRRAGGRVRGRGAPHAHGAR